MSGVAALWGLMIAALAAGPELSPETMLLARIKVRAERNLNRLPNYTCLETIERSRRRVASRKFELIDLVRLEVALVDGREMFAYPGSARFDERDITDMVSGGTIGNGNFAIHARAVFLTNSATFRHLGERIHEGRRTIRFDYRVPMIQSGFKLRVKPSEGTVGYEGAFWADADTLDLVALEVHANDIPPHLPVRSSTEMLRYQMVRIGEEDFLLPQDSDLTLTDIVGNENRNRTRFSNCRQYSGESVIRFDDAPETSAAAPVIPKPLEIPAGLEVELKLETPIEAGVSAVGDLVKATVARDARRKGEIVVPKGAQVTGRLLQLQRYEAWREPVWVAGIQFQRLEFPGRFADFHARLDAASSNLPAPVQDRRGYVNWSVVRRESPGDPRIGILYIRGEKGKLTAGLRTWWHTESPPKEERQ